MALAHDFANYYNNTYIGYWLNGVLVPFFVRSVHGGRGDNIESLKVDGYFLQDGERVFRDNVLLKKENVQLELPEVGYVQIGDRAYWLRYRPQRTMSKGLCGRRLLGAQMSDRLASAIYNRSAEQPIAIQFIAHREKVLYKGRIVGEVVGGKWVLEKPYTYLGIFIAKVFPEIQVEVKQ